MLFDDDRTSATTIGPTWRNVISEVFARGTMTEYVRTKNRLHRNENLTCDKVGLDLPGIYPWIQGEGSVSVYHFWAMEPCWHNLHK